MNKKIGTLVIVMIVLIIIAFIMSVLWHSNSFLSTVNQQPATSTPSDVPYDLTIEGTYTCLEHKNPELPHTQECAFGLKTVNAEQYALDLSAFSGPAGSFETGTHVQVQGLFVPAEQLNTNQYQDYANFKGIIQVRSIDNGPAATSTAYTNGTYGISFRIPLGWNIDSTTMDSSISPASGFEQGKSHMNIQRTNPTTKSPEKIELSLEVTDKSESDYFSSRQESLSNVTTVNAHGLAWKIGKGTSEEGDRSQFVTAQTFIKNPYKNVAGKNIIVRFTGFTFTSPESSKYSADLAGIIAQIVATFSLKV